MHLIVFSACAHMRNDEHDTWGGWDPDVKKYVVYKPPLDDRWFSSYRDAYANRGLLAHQFNLKFSCSM